MADEKAAKQVKEEPVEKIERSRLIAHSHEFFGVGPHIVAGALHDLGKGDADLSVEDAAAAIDKFRKRKVKES